MPLRSHFALALLTVLMGASSARSGEPFEDEEELVFSELRAIRSKDLKARLAWLESISLNHPERVPKVARGLEPRDEWAAAWLANSAHQVAAGPFLVRAVVEKFPARALAVLEPHLEEADCPVGEAAALELSMAGHAGKPRVRAFLERLCDDHGPDDWGLLILEKLMEIDQPTVDALYAAGQLPRRYIIRDGGPSPWSLRSKVAYVCAQGPARNLGLMIGDTIWEIDRVPHNDLPTKGGLPNYITVKRAGTKLEILIPKSVDAGWPTRWIVK